MMWRTDPPPLISDGYHSSEVGLPSSVSEALPKIKTKVSGLVWLYLWKRSLSSQWVVYYLNSPFTYHLSLWKELFYLHIGLFTERKRPPNLLLNKVIL